MPAYEVTHALIHTYARQRLTVDAEAAGHLVAYYVDLAETESAKGVSVYRRLDAKRGHLLRVLRGCVEREDWEGVQRLVWTIGSHDGYLALQGYQTEW